MATDERFDDAISTWLLESAPNRLPERVLAATFERTRKSRQDLAWRAALARPRRRLVGSLGTVAAVVFVAVLALNVGLISGPAATPSPSPSSPTSPPTSASPAPTRPGGSFADLGGWIAFGDSRGVWAVDPTRPGNPDSQAQLSSEPGTPKAWSPDGSKLLVRRVVSNQWVLFVLNADGTETRLADASFRSGGDFSPDGTQVLYAGSVGGVDGIYIIAAEGGSPELVLPAGQRSAGEGCPQGDPCVDGQRFLQASSFAPVFSPDGTQIAFFDGNGDWGHSLRVMNRDGTGVHVVLENSVTVGAGHVEGLDWSPDGERLVFAIEAGVYVVGTDGSDLVELSSGLAYVPLGVSPYWSPDGSLISFNTSGEASGAYSRFVLVRPDGTPVQAFDYGQSGPWNPR